MKSIAAIFAISLIFIGCTTTPTSTSSPSDSSDTPGSAVTVSDHIQHQEEIVDDTPCTGEDHFREYDTSFERLRAACHEACIAIGCTEISHGFTSGTGIIVAYKGSDRYSLTIAGPNSSLFDEGTVMLMIDDRLVGGAELRLGPFLTYWAALDSRLEE